MVGYLRGEPLDYTEGVTLFHTTLASRDFSSIRDETDALVAVGLLVPQEGNYKVSPDVLHAAADAMSPSGCSLPPSFPARAPEPVLYSGASTGQPATSSGATIPTTRPRKSPARVRAGRVSKDQDCTQHRLRRSGATGTRCATRATQRRPARAATASWRPARPCPGQRRKCQNLVRFCAMSPPSFPVVLMNICFYPSFQGNIKIAVTPCPGETASHVCLMMWHALGPRAPARDSKIRSHALNFSGCECATDPGGSPVAARWWTGAAEESCEAIARCRARLKRTRRLARRVKRPGVLLPCPPSASRGGPRKSPAHGGCGGAAQTLRRRLITRGLERSPADRMIADLRDEGCPSTWHG